MTIMSLTRTFVSHTRARYYVSTGAAEANFRWGGEAR